MKIIVNQTAVEEKLINSANRVVEIAKQKASEGISYFYFPKPEGVNSWALISRVNKLTENTVDCAYRGLGKEYIRFELKS